MAYQQTWPMKHSLIELRCVKRSIPRYAECPQCTLHPSIAAIDATVEIYEDKEWHYQWRVSHESIYKLYIESFLPMRYLFACKDARPRVYDSVDYSSLSQIRHLGGRDSKTVVRRSQALTRFIYSKALTLEYSYILQQILTSEGRLLS
jgi:hypothetical protein